VPDPESNNAPVKSDVAVHVRHVRAVDGDDGPEGAD